MKFETTHTNEYYCFYLVHCQALRRHVVIFMYIYEKIKIFESVVTILIIVI